MRAGKGEKIAGKALSLKGVVKSESNKGRTRRKSKIFGKEKKQNPNHKRT